MRGRQHARAAWRSCACRMTTGDDDPEACTSGSASDAANGMTGPGGGPGQHPRPRPGARNAPMCFVVLGVSLPPPKPGWQCLTALKVGSARVSHPNAQQLHCTHHACMQVVPHHASRIILACMQADCALRQWSLVHVVVDPSGHIASTVPLSTPVRDPHMDADDYVGMDVKVKRGVLVTLR